MEVPPLSTFLALTWCVAGALSPSPGSKAGIMSWSVSVFLWFSSDITPVPDSWELTLTGRGATGSLEEGEGRKLEGTSTKLQKGISQYLLLVQ